MAEMLETILGTMMDGFCLVSKDGRFLDANEVFCRMTGYNREELLRMRIKDIEALDTENDIRERLQQIVERGSARFETKHKCKDGKFQNRTFRPLLSTSSHTCFSLYLQAYFQF